MEQIKFWQNWPKPEKYAYLSGLIIFSLLLIFYSVAYFAGNNWTYPWRVINNFEPVEVPFYQVLTGLYNFTIGGDNYINLQEFAGDAINISPWQAMVLLVVVMTCFSVLVALISSFKKFWFFALATVIIFLFLLLQLDTLEIFGQYNRYGLVFGLALFIIPAYIINSYYDHFSLMKRFLIFFITSSIFLACIYFFAEVPNPLYHFISYGLAMPVIISVVFILIVAHDVLSFFMLVITNSNNESSKNSDIHFTFITILYLLSLTFTYLYEIEYIRWDLIYINPFLLLIIVSVIGLWEFRKKRIAYQGVMHFYPVGAFFYLSMALICFATLGYFMATANDAALESFNELILASQVGFGLTFFIYVLVNFLTILHHNQQVYKVLYKPTRMPYFTANLAGFMATLGFFLSANSDMYYEARAAIYNAMGDVAYYSQQTALAEELYTQSTIYGFKNHHANYALGSIELNQQKPGEALYYFEEAIEKEPSENAYAIIANLYKSNDRFFEALFSLQDGLSQFPESGYLLNNAALLYNKTRVIDSTLYYLDLAANTAQREAAIANQHGIYGLNKLTFASDSIVKLYQNTDNLEDMTNLLVLLNFKGTTEQQLPYLLENDTAISFNQHAYLQNFITYQADYLDTSRLQNFKDFADNAIEFFSESMNFNHAIALYKNQQVYPAFEKLQQLSNQSIYKESFYNKVLGLLSLDSDAPLLAQTYFDEANSLAAEGEDLEKPMLMTYLSGDDLLALSSQILINRPKYESQYPQLTKFVDIYSSDSLEWQKQSDTIKYLALRYIPEVSPALAFEINSPFLRNSALIFAGSQILENGDTEKAEKYIAAIELLEEEPLQSKLLRLKMSYLWQKQDLDSLQSLIDDHLKLTDLYSIYYRAKIASGAGEIESATNLYKLAGSMSPFAEDIVMEAAEFFTTQEDYMQAYDILVEAIKINRYSEALTRKYIEISLKLGLENFASSALDNYREKVSYQEYSEMSIYYDSLSQNITDVWQ